MSYSGVYEVTKALRTLLQTRLATVISSAVVTLLPPGDDLPAQPGVNLYLYRVSESPSTRNRPWPGDRSRAATRTPALGLELSYLLTPLGTKPEATASGSGDEAHRMLGAAMLAFEQFPILNDVHDTAFDADTVLSQELLDSFEQIKISLLPTNIDEISKIWAAINKPYRLSVAYEVSLVELTPDAPAPTGGGIVTFTGVGVATMQPPSISALVPPSSALTSSDGAHANTLTIRGFGFSSPGATPTVRIGGQVVSVDTASATDSALVAVLPQRLDAGPFVDVRVVLRGQQSAPVTFIVAPWLARITPVRMALDSTVPDATRTVTLIGEGFTASPLAVRFRPAAGAAVQSPALSNTNDRHATAVVPATLQNGLYDVTLAMSDGTTNARQLEVAPLLREPVVVGTATVNTNTVSTLTIDGERLGEPVNGAAVTLVLDGVSYEAGPNKNAVQLVYTLGRRLAPGVHTLFAVIDGHRSNTVNVDV